MTKDNFDKCVELVISLNPQNVDFCEDEFNFAMRRFLCGDKERLTQLNFVYACDWLLKDYIEEDKTSFEEFEDEVMDAYLFATQMKVEPIMRFKPYRTYLRNQTAKYFEKAREEKLEKNMQLNYQTSLNIEYVEDENAEQEIYGSLREKETKAYLDRFSKRCKMSPKRIEIAEDNLGFYGEEKTREETAKKFGVTKEQVLCASAKYLRELRQDVFAHPSKFPLDNPYKK